MKAKKAAILISMIIFFLNMSLAQNLEGLINPNNSVIGMVTNKSIPTEHWPKLLKEIPLSPPVQVSNLSKSEKVYVNNSTTESPEELAKKKNKYILAFFLIGVVIITAYAVYKYYNTGEIITFDKEFGGFGISET